MNIDAVLDGLLQDGQEDWIGLWEISQDVQELLDIDDPMQNLEVTITLVKGLLERGFSAGESPVASVADFIAWPDQNPDSVADLIRREWRHRGTLPGWGDCPWFARKARRCFI